MQTCPQCEARVGALPLLFSSPTRVFVRKNCGQQYLFRQPFGLAMLAVVLCVAMDTYLNHYASQLGVWVIDLCVVASVILIYCWCAYMFGRTRAAAA